MTDTNLVFVFDAPDPALDQWRRDNPEMHEVVAAGTVHVGYVSLTVVREVDRVRLTLSPLTRSMQKAWLDSHRARQGLASLLSSHGGLVGYLDRGDGSLEELWPRDTMPAGYEHELVR